MIKTCNALEANIKRTVSDPVAEFLFFYFLNMSLSLFM